MSKIDSTVEAGTVQSDSGQSYLCALCFIQFSKYTCPRCNVQYCSLDCYKSEKHAQCSENFYRESFMSELQSQTTSSAERSKMMEILMRLGEEGMEENTGHELDEDGSLEERLAGLDLDAEDTDALWQRLTKSEQEQFQKAVSSGHLSSLLPIHTPWWKKPAVVIDGSTGASSNSSIPSILPDLPPINTLVKGGKTSPTVRYNILNVLYAYAYTVRLYNGDHHDLAVDATQTVLDISNCLADNASYSMAGEALTHAVTTVQQTQNLVSNPEMVFSNIKDVSHILCSPPPSPPCCRAAHALSDLHILLTTAMTQLHSQKGFKKHYKSIQMASKKVYFLTVWAAHNKDHLQSLAKVVDIEYETSVSSWRIHTEETSSQRHRKALKTTSKLITELT